MSSSQLGHLPSRVHSVAEFMELADGIERIEARTLRLKVQAFALLVRDVFDRLEAAEEINILGDGTESQVFAAFEVPERAEGAAFGAHDAARQDPPQAAPATDDDLSDFTSAGLRIGLPSEAFSFFEEQSPYTRADYEEQLREAYEQAIHAEGSSAWETFW